MSKTSAPTYDACYAHSLGGCGGKMSGEHFLSKSLLRKIEAPEGGVWLGGFPWQKDPSRRKRVGINSVVSNVLCVDHNSKLSGLDSAALGLVEAIEESFAQRRGPHLRKVNGDLIERFLLKMLCGIVASGSGSKTTGESLRTTVPSRWVEMAFGVREFPAGAGLYVPGDVGDVWNAEPNAYIIEPLILNGDAVGLFAVIRNRKFILTTQNPGKIRTGALPASAMWRPRRLRNKYPRGSHILQFAWTGDHSGRAITERMRAR